MEMEKQQQYKKVFSHFDTDGDGKISPSELQKCVASIGGELSLEDCMAVVDSSDADGDGFLGFEEFVKFVDGGEEEEKVKVLMEAFKMYQMGDGSDWITPESLKRMLNRLGESRSVDQCRSMIAQFDVNGDGVLKFDEFRRRASFSASNSQFQLQLQNLLPSTSGASNTVFQNQSSQKYLKVEKEKSQTLTTFA